MKIYIPISFALSVALLSCSNEEQQPPNGILEDSIPKPVEVVEKVEETVKSQEIPAIADSTKHIEGAVESFKTQLKLVREGNFDEALNYYTNRMKQKVIKRLEKNPEDKLEWQKASQMSDEKYNEIIESIKESPDFFIFEDGMWRVDQL